MTDIPKEKISSSYGNKDNSWKEINKTVQDQKAETINKENPK